MARVGVLLSGCGVQDGSEIHEAVITMLALDEAGAEIVCMAPNKPQRRVADHARSQDANETRNVLVESARIFRRLDTAVRNQIARAATEKSYKRGETIVKQGGRGDDFFLLVDGEVEIVAHGKRLTKISAKQEDNFFGEMAAIDPGRRRSASVKATKATRILRLRGQDLRHLFEQHMGVRFALLVAIKDRQG